MKLSLPCSLIALLSLLLAGSLVPPAATAERPGTKAALPRLFLIDPQMLTETRRRAADNDATLVPAMARLRRDADKALRSGPYSVMDKKAVPPSGDKHDYMSVGPYWWPDPSKPDGKPYIRRDGQVNPERHLYDNTGMAKMTGAVETLALAYYLTGDEPYAAGAAKLLRTWFLGEATRMNPHLRYGQAIPGRCDGRGVGIIDTLRLVRLVDAVGMLRGSDSWAPDDQKGLEAWFAAYLRWLCESKIGLSEGRARNNHGTWYDVQVASFALFVGQRDTARQVLNEAAERRIATQIKPDGRQPHELARTKSFSYSVMNLQGMMALAILGRNVEVDLWNYQSPDGCGIRKALDWLTPFAANGKKWTHKQITSLHPDALVPLLRYAAIAYKEPRYEKLIAKLSDPGDEADRLHLICPALRHR